MKGIYYYLCCGFRSNTNTELSVLSSPYAFTSVDYIKYYSLLRDTYIAKCKYTLEDHKQEINEINSPFSELFSETIKAFTNGTLEINKSKIQQLENQLGKLVNKDIIVNLSMPSDQELHTKTQKLQEILNDLEVCNTPSVRLTN